MECKFKIGDSVILKSGGPKMTVKEIKQQSDPAKNTEWNHVDCEWFNQKEQSFKHGSFKEETLTIWVDPPLFF